MTLPWLHLDDDNLHKEQWISKLKGKYQLALWSLDKDLYHINLFYPEIDINLFPISSLRTFANIAKLHDYGGIVVSGEDTKPPNNLENMKFEDIHSLSFWRNYSKLDLMISPLEDPISQKYLTSLLRDMSTGIWRNVKFLGDVNIINL